MRFDWTPQRVAVLEEKLHEGWTYARIAFDLGCSSNAAIGKSHRMGFAAPTPYRGGIDQKPRVIARRNVDKAGPVARPERVVPTAEVFGCRYPYGDPLEAGFGHCNAPQKPGSSYCSAHHRLCYMRTGASRHAIADRGNDLYETAACAVHALLRVEPTLFEPRRIWEPCAGRGAISRELLAAGHAVTSFDLCAYDGADLGIVTPVDFLMEHRAPEGVEMIVTNPPYKLADDFVRHGLSFGLPVIVLLRLMALEGAGRSDLIDSKLSRVWAGIERLPAMHREGWEGKRSTNSGAAFAWFVFNPFFGGGAIELRRMSWRPGEKK